MDKVNLSLIRGGETQTNEIGTMRVHTLLIDSMEDTT